MLLERLFEADGIRGWPVDGYCELTDLEAGVAIGRGSDDVGPLRDIEEGPAILLAPGPFELDVESPNLGFFAGAGLELLIADRGRTAGVTAPAPLLVVGA